MMKTPMLFVLVLLFAHHSSCQRGSQLNEPGSSNSQREGPSPYEDHHYRPRYEGEPGGGADNLGDETLNDGSSNSQREGPSPYEDHLWRPTDKGKPGKAADNLEDKTLNDGYKRLCPRYIEPVCGADGKTYWNKCRAELAEVTIVAAGECRDDPLQISNDGGHVEQMRDNMRTTSAAVRPGGYLLEQVVLSTVGAHMLLKVVVQ